MCQNFKLTSQETAALVRLYHEQELALDQLPYTDNFNKIVEAFQAQFKETTHNHLCLYRCLMRLRKNSRLVRKPNLRRGRRKQENAPQERLLFEGG